MPSHMTENASARGSRDRTCRHMGITRLETWDHVTLPAVADRSHVDHVYKYMLGALKVP